jgi:hypothetical protein
MANRQPKGSGQTWKTFLRNHAAGIGALDFLVVPTINFRLLSVLVILRHERRRLISLSVTDHPTAEWIAQQITEAFPWDKACPYRKPHPYWTKTCQWITMADNIRDEVRRGSVSP